MVAFLGNGCLSKTSLYKLLPGNVFDFATMHIWKEEQRWWHVSNVCDFLLMITFILMVCTRVIISCVMLVYPYGNYILCNACISITKIVVLCNTSFVESRTHGFKFVHKFISWALINRKKNDVEMLISKKWGWREEDDEVMTYDLVVMKEGEQIHNGRGTF